MIYQCYECEGLFDENDGVITYDTLHVMGGDAMIFKCKNCMSEKARKKLEEVQKKK